MIANKQDAFFDETQVLYENTPSAQSFTTNSQLREARRAKSRSVVCGVLLNLFITATPVYFIVFSWFGYKYSGLPADLSPCQALLRASIYGPTIFPLVFAAVIGRCMKSIAEYKLERGTTVAPIEYLLASRTVSGALVAPLRFRVVKFIVLPLILLWSLSPLGSQASLRMVSTVTVFQNSSQIVSYLDVNGSRPLTDGVDGAQWYLNAVNAAFSTGLYGPVTAKDASQDAFGHVKIPMLEVIDRSSAVDKNGWVAVPPSAHNLSTYISLTGLPCSGVSTTGSVTFSLETSYFKTQCSLDRQPLQDLSILKKWANMSMLKNGTVWNGGQFAFAWDVNHTSTPTQARNMTFWSVNEGNMTLSTAKCLLTSSFVEAQVECNSGICSAIAVRRSTLSAPPDTWSSIDTLPYSSANIWAFFINATSKGHVSTSSPIEQYLRDPRIPISSMSEVILADTDPASFSQRVAQLLNTYWMIVLSPNAALGVDVKNDPSYAFLGMDPTSTPNAGTVIKPTLANIRYSQGVLYCDKAWLAVLFLSALIMFFAGLLTTVLDAHRKGPDIIDLFVSTLRENPYAHIEHHSTLEDGSSQVRRLQNVKVRLGDVRPLSTAGYCAIATPDGKMNVQRLTDKRQYI